MKTLGRLTGFFLLLMSCLLGLTWSELDILVKNGGGDVLKTKITADTNNDTITAQFVESDGSHVTLLIDFKARLQIFKVYILGEPERGQSKYQVFCFVIGLTASDFIPSDAMSKLRQKNPGTIRVAEEDGGQDEFDFDTVLDLKKSSILSYHVKHLCAHASSTFIHSTTMESLLQFSGFESNNTEMASIGLPLPLPNGKRCSEVHVRNQPCSCEYTICLHWYPCAIKYCKDKDSSSGKFVSRRCGIKSCKKCRTFHFHANNKQACLWDELPLLAP